MQTLNLGILAHVDAGKTSLPERLLYAATPRPIRSRWSGTAASRSSPWSCRSSSTMSP